MPKLSLQLACASCRCLLLKLDRVVEVCWVLSSMPRIVNGLGELAKKVFVLCYKKPCRLYWAYRFKIYPSKPCCFGLSFLWFLMCSVMPGTLWFLELLLFSKVSSMSLRCQASISEAYLTHAAQLVQRRKIRLCYFVNFFISYKY